ncbi:MAG: histidine phosphatase family protein [Rhodobacterales bacterium]|nr:histidine phosphatase family protein [Rhodobacterales bacterium]
MTKRLILMRHAKSAWDDPRLPDVERVLNARGQQSANAMGAWLKAQKYVPDQIMCSSAARTMETSDRLMFDARIEPIDALYLAPEGLMEQVLMSAFGDCVLIIGHNPGITEFAASLVISPPEHTRFYDYPTCATLIVDFDIEDWAEIIDGTGKVVDFITPGEIL